MKNIHVILTDKPSRLSDCHNNNLYLDDVRYLRNYQNIYITSEEEIIGGKEWFLDTISNTVHKAELATGVFNTRKKIILTTDQDIDGVQAIDDEFLEWICKNPSCEEVEVFRDSKQSTDSNGFLYIEWLGYKIEILKEEPKQDAFNYSLNAFKVPKEYFGKEEPKLGNTINKDELGIPKGVLTGLIGVNKQETLEEAAEKYANDWDEIHPLLAYEEITPIEVSKIDFIEGAKWQQENSNTNDLDFEIKALKSLIQDMDATVKSKYSEEEVLPIVEYIQWIIRKIDKGNTPEEIVRLLLFNRDKIEQFKKK